MKALMLVLPVFCALIAVGCTEAPEEPPAQVEAPPEEIKQPPEQEKTPEPAEPQEEKEPGEEPEKEPPAVQEVEQTADVEVGILETKFGTIVIQFFPDIAPKTVERIKQLIREGFYDGLTFHRVAPGVCIQGGDPEGSGIGGTGVRIPGEFSSTPYVKGSMGMARGQDRNSNDCQFFFCLSRNENWDNNYTLFAKIIEGLEVLDKIVGVPLEGRRGFEKPKEKVYMISFRLEERNLRK